MGPGEPAAHKPVWNPNTFRDFQIRHLLKTNTLQLLNILPLDQTLSSQGGPHMENCSSISCVSFCQCFWQMRELKYWDIGIFMLQWITSCYCCWNTKLRSKTIHARLHDSLLQKILQKIHRKILQSHALRCTRFIFQVSIFHRSAKLLFIPNTVQMNCISFFPWCILIISSVY